MIIFDETLYNLQQKTARKKHLESMKNDLYDQKRELDKNLFSLKYAKNKEQGDVDKLNKTSLSNFFYRLTGKWEEKLTTEQKEACEAAIKYDTALKEMETIEFKLKQIQEELDTLKNVEREFHDALDKEKTQLKESNNSTKEELLKLEKSLTTLQAQEKEIREAMAAGNRCLYAANDVISNLKKASDWGTWDVIGGGTMSTLIKHDYMSKAQSSVSALQSELRYFKSELADVKIYSNLNVSTDGFTKFADFFFDNIFVDLSVQDRIRSSLNSVTGTKSQIQNSISKLDRLMEDNRNQQANIKKQIEDYLIGQSESC